MVLYTGDNTKILQRNYVSQLKVDKPMFKKPKTLRYVNSMVLFFMVTSIAVSFILFIILLTEGDKLTKIEMIEKNIIGYSKLKKLLAILSSMLNLVPTCLIVVQDLFILLSALRLNYKMIDKKLLFKEPEYQLITEQEQKITQLRQPRVGGRRAKSGSTVKSMGSGVMKTPPPESPKLKDRKPTKGSSDYTSPNRFESPRQSNIRRNTGKPAADSKDKGSTEILGGKKDLNSDPILPPNFVSVSNYAVLPDLGNIDHVMFDKTDTLTSGKMKVAEISTYLQCYLVPSRDIEAMISECDVNPEAYSYEDEMGKVIESGDYSEKSQEYAAELEGEFNKEVVQEGSDVSLLDLKLFPDYTKLGREKRPEEMVSSVSLTKKTSPSDRTKVEDIRGVNSGFIHFLNSAMKDPPEVSKELRQLNILEKKFRLAVGSNYPTTDKFNLRRTAMMLNGPRTREDTKDLGSVGGLHDSMVSKVSSMDDSNQDLRIDFKVDKKLSEKNFIFDVNSRKDHLKDLLNLLMICIECSFSDVKLVRSMNLEDRAICDMLTRLGIEIKVKNARQEELKDTGERRPLSINEFTTYQIMWRKSNFHDYDIICVNAYTKNRGRMSIILRDTADPDEYVLIVKGEDSSFRGCFNHATMESREFNLYKAMLTDYRVQGLKRIVLGVKKISETDVVDYLTIYNTISDSSREQLDTFESHADKLEKGLNFGGCIGVKDIVREEAHHLISDLVKAKIQVNILSGDSIDNCLIVAKELGLTKVNFSDTSSYFSVNFKTEKQAFIDLRRMLDSIYELLMDSNLQLIEDLLEKDKGETNVKTKFSFFSKLTRQDNSNTQHSAQAAQHTTQNPQFQSQPQDQDLLLSSAQSKKLKYRKTLVINGNSLYIVLSNPQLRDYMKTILLFSDCIIGHSMQPSQKAVVVNLLKSLSMTVMSVGDGFNDLSMFNHSSIAVQLCVRDVPILLADIQISNLSSLRYLIFCYGATMNCNTMLMNFLAVWINVLWGSIQGVVLVATVYSYTQYTAYEVVIIAAFVAVSGIHFYFTHVEYRDDLSLACPALYLERRIMPANLWKIMIVIAGYALLEGFYIVLSVLQLLASDFGGSGETLGGGQVGLVCSYITGFSALVKMYLTRSRYDWVSSLVLVSLMICLFGLLAAEFLWPNYDIVYPIGYKSMISNIMTFFMWAFCSGITNYIAWTIVLFIKNSFVQPIGKLILRHKRAKKLNELTRANMQKLIYDVCSKKLPDLLESQPLIQIRSCFDAKTILDGSVKRILNIDCFSFSLPIDLFQRIKEVTDRRKFRVFRPPNEIYYTRLYLTITIILFLIEYCLLLVMSDLRRNYLMDSPCSYGVIIYTALLMMTYSDLKHETLTIFTMTANLAFAILNLVVACIDMPLYFRSGYFAAARFMVAPIGSDFFFGALSAVLINLTFAIQLMAAGRTPSNQFPLSLFIARRALGFIYYIILIVITKSRYDKLIKLTFVSQERIKAAMASSNEKLMLLMPKFVLDRINYFEMSSKYLLANC
jgi:magnesium-transporting ATPase (P-type)